ncbi:MAG: sulfatase-like hydrolase/transferase [Chloroflexota bacterium]
MTNSPTRPNFLVFIVDQMSAFSLACHGNPDVQTPNLDRLAAQGVSFTRAYCANPVCSPSRASLHTGLTPRQHGLPTNGCKLSEHIPTLPQALAESELALQLADRLAEIDRLDAVRYCHA